MDVEQLWIQYAKQPNPLLREKLVTIYEYLVRYVVNGFSSPSCVLEEKDLHGFGRIGLLEAINRFDPKKNVSFKTFAIHRIRGAILDGVRQVEWAPRSIQFMTKKSLKAMSELEHELNRPPSEQEVAGRLAISLKEYRKFLDTINARRLVSLQDLLNLEKNPKSEPVADNATFFDGYTDQSELKDKLRMALLNLPVKERLIITLYFYEGLNLNDIASVLSVSESRVSQMRSQALLRLRKALLAEVMQSV